MTAPAQVELHNGLTGSNFKSDVEWEFRDILPEEPHKGQVSASEIKDSSAASDNCGLPLPTDHTRAVCIYSLISFCL